MISQTIDRLKLKSKIIGNHCIWMGARNKNTNHGLVRHNGKQVYVHRLAFCIVHNLDYNGSFLVCHKIECNNPRCWNLDCLYQGTSKSNTLDVVALGYHNEAMKTHCPRGHEYTHSNTRYNNKKRVCLNCRRQRDRNRIRYTRNGRRYTVPGTRKL